jgi:hypothetical protein
MRADRQSRPIDQSSSRHSYRPPGRRPEARRAARATSSAQLASPWDSQGVIVASHVGHMPMKGLGRKAGSLAVVPTRRPSQALGQPAFGELRPPRRPTPPPSGDEQAEVHGIAARTRPRPRMLTEHIRCVINRATGDAGARHDGRRPFVPSPAPPAVPCVRTAARPKTPARGSSNASPSQCPPRRPFNMRRP